MKTITIIALLALSFTAHGQSTPLFNKLWESEKMASFSQGKKIANAFPAGFRFTRKRNWVYRESYSINVFTGETSSVIDTFNVKKKSIAYSKGGRKIESAISISKDEKEIRIQRDFFYSYDPKRLEFSYDEVFKLMDSGDAMLEKTSKSPDPDSDFNYVGTKVYPKDGQVKPTN